MRLGNKIIFGCSLFLLMGCTSTKLMDSWKSQSFNRLSTAKILVIARSAEENIRKSYELGIANKLRAKHIDAIEAHVRFPLLQEAKTTAERDQILRQFEEAGITAVILTALKQTIETQNANLNAHTKTPKGYENEMSFGSKAVSPSTPVLSTSKTYVLEGLIYDLTLQKGKQLVNVCLVDVTDPDSADKVKKSFTKIISDQF